MDFSGIHATTDTPSGRLALVTLEDGKTAVVQFDSQSKLDRMRFVTKSITDLQYLAGKKFELDHEPPPYASNVANIIDQSIYYVPAIKVRSADLNRQIEDQEDRDRNMEQTMQVHADRNAPVDSSESLVAGAWRARTLKRRLGARAYEVLYRVIILNEGNREIAARLRVSKPRVTQVVHVSIEALEWEYCNLDAGFAAMASAIRQKRA